METPLKSTITCPFCQHEKEEEIPTNSCQYFYECEKCKNLLKPKNGIVAFFALMVIPLVHLFKITKAVVKV